MAVPYTAATIRAYLRLLLNEPTASYWTDTELNNYVVVGCREVSRTSLCVEDTLGLCLKTGVMEYNTATSIPATLDPAAESDVTIGAGPPGTFTSASAATFIADGWKHGFPVAVTDTAADNDSFVVRDVTAEKEMKVFATLTGESQGTVSFSYYYTWIADIVKIYGCVYHTGDNVSDDLSYKGLQKIHPRNLRRVPNLTDGPPFYWWWFGDKIGIYPEPTSSENLDCVLVYHSKVTEAIADIPDEYQPAVVYYAMSRARMKERSMGESQMWLSMYLNSMAYQRQTQYDRGVDSKEMGHIPDKTVSVG